MCLVDHYAIYARVFAMYILYMYTCDSAYLKGVEVRAASEDGLGIVSVFLGRLQ